jgi:hypothetical protein
MQTYYLENNNKNGFAYILKYGTAIMRRQINCSKQKEEK